MCVNVLMVRRGVGFFLRRLALPLGGLGTPAWVAQTSLSGKFGGSFGERRRPKQAVGAETRLRTGRQPPRCAPQRIG